MLTLAYLCRYPTTYKDKVVQAYPWDFEEGRFDRDSQALDVFDALKSPENVDPGCLIPFYETPADLLFIAGADDRVGLSVSSAEFAQRKMNEAGKKNYEICIVASMGHRPLLPYSPPSTVGFHPLLPPGGLVLLGGGRNLQGHIRGQITSWNKTVDYFKRKLTPLNRVTS